MAATLKNAMITPTPSIRRSVVAQNSGPSVENRAVWTGAALSSSKGPTHYSAPHLSMVCFWRRGIRHQ